MEFTNKSFAYCSDEHMYKMFRAIKDKPLDRVVSPKYKPLAAGQITILDPMTIVKEAKINKQIIW